MHPFQSILVHCFQKCWRSFLPSPVWPLPNCLDSCTSHPRFLCKIDLYSIRVYFHHQSHPQMDVVFALAPSLHFLWLFLHWSPVAYWAPIFQCPVFFAFSYSSWGSQGKNTEVVYYSLLQWTIFCQNSPPFPVHLGWLYMAWLIVSLS